MVVSEGKASQSGGRSVRPKLVTSESRVERKHRLKQRFEVIKKLGQGTYGKVQLAINKESEQEVAIKTIKKSKVESDQDLIRIRREIQIMSSIQHPHIVHIFEVFENKEKIVLVMQYASGGEVYDYVSARKVLSDYEARRLFRQIATAIYYCHKNKICHRDLKLENILLDEKGNAKIADFGLSNVFDERHFLSTFCGSPLYASPEIVKGTPYYGPEVDCWSLGVLLYTLVYGAMPFDGSNFKKLVKQISEANYFEPKQKSDASALIRKLLTPNPTKRATIIDICTDSWVNRGYEHSLLQVAEDMANLTPVRLDVLLALAPTSPSAANEKTDSHPLDVKEDKEIVNQETIDKPDESLQDVNDSKNDLTGKKRQASTSFDQSVSKVGQTPRKKKTKKSQTDLKSTPDKSNEEIKVKPETDNKETVESTTVSSDVIDIKDESLEGKELDKLINLENIEDIEKSAINSSQNEEKNINVNIEQDSVEVINEVLPDLINKDNTELDNKTFEEKNNSETLDQIGTNELINSKADEVSSSDNLIVDSLDDAKKEIIKDQASNEVKEETVCKKTEEKKKKVNRTSSTKTRPGKLSIPKIWDKSFDGPESGSPSIKSPEMKPNIQVCDSKKPLDGRQQEKKAPFIPVGFKVSDAKRAFERRCSVPAISHLTPTFNKTYDFKRSTEVSEASHKIKPKPPKLSSRSLSLNDDLESPKKVQETLYKATKLNNVEKHDQNENNDNDAQKTGELSLESVKTNVSVDKDIEKKSLAKDILKKTIAKAKLNEKRQNSNDSDSTGSSITTPLLSIENSNISITQQQPTFRIPRPFNKDNLEKVNIKPNTTVEMKLDSNLMPKTNTDNDLESVSVLNNLLKSSAEEESLLEENVESPQPLQMKPIARSYKKVTFTKDGACITETGKIYSSEGADGTFTRVEKKSKVTHFPSQEEENLEFDAKFNLQKSDSVSSSGSTDIFEDIFDNHWSGDSIFSNMRSLLHGVMGHRKDKKTRRKSRAESCERNNNDWFSSGFNSKTYNSNLTDQESDTDNDHESPLSNQQGLWQMLHSHGSIFDKSALFSRHFSKDSQRELFDEVNRPFHEFNRSLSRDRSLLSSRIHPSSFKAVFGSSSVKNDDFDSMFSKLGSFNKYDVNSKINAGERSRMWAKDGLESNAFEKEFKSNFDDKIEKSSDVSRKRVEQWLESDISLENDDFDRRTPFSMYGTVGPRGFRRYLRTMGGRPQEKAFKDNTNDSTTSIRSTNYDRLLNTQLSSNYSPSSLSNQNKSIIDMKFSLNSDNNYGLNSSSNISDVNSISIANCPSSPSLDVSESGDDFQNSIALPESSSLLEQLRTHGYRNIVTQRLTGSSSMLSNLEWKSSESTSESDSNYKKGNYKSVSDTSSSDFKRNDYEACECMETNPVVISNAMATNGATASDANANYADCADSAGSAGCALKASEPIAATAQVESADSHQSNTDTVNMLLKHTVNQQSCEPTSRVTTYTARSNTIGDLPECNHPLQTNKTINNSVTLKETVQERIHRKSFYSRFNDDRPHASRQRRRSYLDSDSEMANKYLLNRKTSNLSSSNFRTSFLSDNNFLTNKPPISSSSNWFNRMESRASQLMDDLMANDHISDHQRSRDIGLGNYIPVDRRRSSSSTGRSSFSAQRSTKSDYDSFSTSYSNNLSDNDSDNEIINSSKYNNSMDDNRSPTEVLRRAIDLLAQKE